MQPSRPSHHQQRAPGSFSPVLPGSATSASSSAALAAATSAASPVHHAHHHHALQPSAAASAAAASSSAGPARPQIRRIDSSSSDDTGASTAGAGAATTIHNPRSRPGPASSGVASPVASAPFGQHPNSSASSLHNFSRPHPARPGTTFSDRTASPLNHPSPTPSAAAISRHVRKHSTQGLFEPSLPSASASQSASASTGIGMAQSAALAAAAAQSQSQSPNPAAHAAANAAAQYQQHSRHRSQTVPFPGGDNPSHESTRRPSVPRPPAPPMSPPTLSLTEASVPRDSGFAPSASLKSSSAATVAANVVFPRSPQTGSPSIPATDTMPPMPPPPPPLVIPDKPSKPDKSKVKLFSRPKKIDTKGDTKEKPLPSPGKIGSALASLQRANYSSTSLAESQGSFYNMANSSAATIRAVDAPAGSGDANVSAKDKDKEKRHHFLSRQKHKLGNDFHLPLSSAASNSRPVDPSAPSSLYNFNLPPSPSLNGNFGKSVSGLDLRHGGRALRDKRKDERFDVRHDNESVMTMGSEWTAPTTYGSTANTPLDTLEPSRYGLNSMSHEDAWPWLRANLLSVFELVELQLPIEDFNRAVIMHIQYCIQRRAGHIIVEDLRDLLATGFSSLDHTLRKTPEDRLIPALVDLWVTTFTNILPYLQAVFLPLDLEFSGSGNLLTPDQARDFWGGVLAESPAPGSYSSGPSFFESHLSPASEMLEVRRLVLLAYRDAVIISRYDKLKTIFSRLSLEHLPSSLASIALASPAPPQDSLTSLSTSPNDGYPARPGTAASLDPSLASYNSSSTTLLNDTGSNPSRSRAISNVSYGSGTSEPSMSSTGHSSSGLLRPFTPQMGHAGSSRDMMFGNPAGGGSARQQNVEDSKQVTDMVGRMLQCMSVLASVSVVPTHGHGTAGDGGGAAATTAWASGGAGGSAAAGGDDSSKMVAELGRLLKLNWLGRGRTGRNRRGMVGGRVKRESSSALSAALSAGHGPGHHSRSSSDLAVTPKESIGVAG